MVFRARHSDSRTFTVEQFRGRLRWVFILMICACAGVVGRAVTLQILQKDFLASQGNARYTRVAKLAAHRGAIYDRNGETLAISTPVDSVWINPKELNQAADQIPRLAEALNRERKSLEQVISRNLDREFIYLKRRMNPKDAAQVKALGIPGVYLQREYRRYYPAGEVTGHVLGFTDIDDNGREGLELAYDGSLRGAPGLKRVIQDRLGRSVEDIESIRAARPGEDITTSLDVRIQYLAYRELKAAVQQNNAVSGSLVVIDVETGEVLAMVNQPSFNPNDDEQRDPSNYRNRSATDILEPGSSIKPFVAAAAVASGRFHADSVIDTSPGIIRVGIKIFTDPQPLGTTTLTKIIAKSSNVGMIKVAQTLTPETMWKILDAFGFGQVTGSGFPGEAAGMLPGWSHWRPITQATMSHGYNLSVTALQLAHAYAVLGAGGVSRPLSLRRVAGPVAGTHVLHEPVARELLTMMESVVSEEGTAQRAALLGYRVAGKTGTAWKAQEGGYSTDSYVASFGGVVPVEHPKLAAVVIINEPRGKLHHGGDVAAPVFSNVMAGALRLLAVPPDGLQSIPSGSLIQASAVP